MSPTSHAGLADLFRCPLKYMKLLCNYIYDPYGRFPAHVAGDPCRRLGSHGR
jgi:hypothetical protein